jgi:NRAMP (natural resistance-associated macrophage protein)-like metal ion transporter
VPADRPVDKAAASEQSPELGGWHGFVVGLHGSFRRPLRILGPGLITGAADDDPSGIATYTQTGAQFGYSQLWTAVFMLPFQTAVQEACARIGAVTGKGLAAVVRERYHKVILFLVVALVVVANVINIGADIGALAESTHLLLPLHIVILAPAYAALILVLQVYVSYRTYARVLKWLALALVAYLVTALIVAEPWQVLLRATFVPHIEFSSSFLFIITGVLGTTITPYMFFWQASQEVEEEQQQRMTRTRGHLNVTRTFIRNLRIDTAVGMFVSEIATWCIIVVGATVLHAHGITNVATAADAAKALEPLVHTFPNAGYLSKLIFASGVIGLGLLAIPVLSGSASYALCEAFKWHEGLSLRLSKGWAFYGVIAGATLIGLGLNFVGIDPIKALVFTAVFNGIAAVPLVFLIARVARNRKVMGEYRSGILSSVLVWCTFGGMSAAAFGLFFTLVKG